MKHSLHQWIRDGLVFIGYTYIFEPCNKSTSKLKTYYDIPIDFILKKPTCLGHFNFVSNCDRANFSNLTIKSY